MHTTLLRTWTSVATLLLATVACGPRRVIAQDSSLLNGDLPRRTRPLTVQNSSWTYQPLKPASRIKLHDIITVIVDEKSKVLNKAQYDREKIGTFDAVLQDNPVLRNFSLKPSPQSSGDPRLKMKLDSIYEADSQLRTRGAVTFRMAAQVVDIRPNGNLVIEGHKQFRNNEEVWERSITGIVRPESLAEGNVVLSRDIAELRIFKRERGEVRDGYRRGWLMRMWDQVRLF